MKQNKVVRMLGGVTAVTLLLGAAACGSSDTSDAGTDATNASSSSAGTYDAVLEPQPLAKRTKITIAAPPGPFEPFALPGIAEKLGEFDRENLDVSVQRLPSADAYGLLANGKIDVIVGSPGAALFNGVASGLDLRIVAPGGVTSYGDSIEGWWVSKKVADKMPESLDGLKVGSASGVATVSMVTLSQWLTKNGGSFDDVEVKQACVRRHGHRSAAGCCRHRVIERGADRGHR
ncbi:ABC transporter substrate-binding protein [Aeromicrobium sp. UC242_57]|uniref:ABC transporter substrate-binding protein n=1 Tax=Aeromicrobium sp. UC242_57 TaxID=3374624 RepID=UPI0037A2D8BE